MAVAFYVLLRSDAPLSAKVVFTVVPVAIWILGGLAIYRESREHEAERRREEEILQEAKRILNSKSHQEEKKD